MAKVWRAAENANGWSSPAFFVIQGGSFGFQIGGQAVDLVMIIMNENGMRNLLAEQIQTGRGRFGRGRSVSAATRKV